MNPVLTLQWLGTPLHLAQAAMSVPAELLRDRGTADCGHGEAAAAAALEPVAAALVPCPGRRLARLA